MKICHVCKQECEENAELCPVCGAVLTEEPAKEDADAPEEVYLQNPVLVATMEDVVSAEIFKDILRENGIVFTCEGAESGGSMRVLFGGGFAADELYVDETDLEKAKQLYEEFLKAEPSFEDGFFEDELTE